MSLYDLYKTAQRNSKTDELALARVYVKHTDLPSLESLQTLAANGKKAAYSSAFNFFTGVVYTSCTDSIADPSLQTQEYATRLLQERVDKFFPDENIRAKFTCDNGCYMVLDWVSHIHK